MESVLKVRGARKRFGDRAALDGLDLKLRRGEWLALLGPNGAGKTTLVKAIAGRVRLDGGQVALLGHSLDGSAADGKTRRRLGIVPQELALHPALTARENLRTFGVLAGVAREEVRGRVERALDWTGLAERADEAVNSFSGGMKRRLNIACSVLHEPEVLLLDEAQNVSDRIAIIDHGRKVADGSFDELLRATIGTARRVRITFGIELAEPPAGYERGSEPNELSKVVEDLGAELPAALSEIQAAGLEIRNLAVETPSLRAVFLHLTGRDLRE